MKREFFELEEEPVRYEGYTKRQTQQFVSQDEWTIPEKTVSRDKQLDEYKTRMNILRTCGNRNDPLIPESRLNPSHPLFAMYDVLQNKWCFDLIVLWKHLEGYENYDIQSLYNHFGANYVIKELRIPTSLFKITISTFSQLKREFYKYAYGIDIPQLY